MSHTNQRRPLYCQAKVPSRQVLQRGHNTTCVKKVAGASQGAKPTPSARHRAVQTAYAARTWFSLLGETTPKSPTKAATLGTTRPGPRGRPADRPGAPARRVPRGSFARSARPRHVSGLPPSARPRVGRPYVLPARPVRRERPWRGHCPGRTHRRYISRMVRARAHASTAALTRTRALIDEPPRGPGTAARARGRVACRLSTVREGGGAHTSVTGQLRVGRRLLLPHSVRRAGIGRRAMHDDSVRALAIALGTGFG